MIGSVGLHVCFLHACYKVHSGVCLYTLFIIQLQQYCQLLFISIIIIFRKFLKMRRSVICGKGIKLSLLREHADVCREADRHYKEQSALER